MLSARLGLRSLLGTRTRLMHQGSKKAGCELLKCPLCSGRGELPSDELFDRLQEKDFSRKVESYLANVVEPECKTATAGPTFDQHVHTWNCTHFLWRRSSKE